MTESAQNATAEPTEEAKASSHVEYYIAMVGADVVTGEASDALKHLSIALGLIIGGLYEDPATQQLLLKSMADTMAESLNKLGARNAERIKRLVKTEVQERAKPGEPIAMHIVGTSMAGATDAAGHARMAVDALRKSGANVSGVAVLAKNGDVLHSEGVIPDGMLPADAQAPTDRTKH